MIRLIECTSYLLVDGEELLLLLEDLLVSGGALLFDKILEACGFK